jgi:capsid protein
VGASLEYGLIPLDKATSFDYVFYEQWEQQWAEYEEKLDLYNSGTLNFKQRQALRDELEALQFILGDYRWEPLGIVTDVYIHW